MRKNSKTPRRVRKTLLILLWIWAVCVFMVVDLFRNVAEFDAIRPRAKLYRAMRYAAHKMVGEPYYEGDFAHELRPTRQVRSRPRVDADSLRAGLADVWKLEQQRSFDGLRKQALEGEDTRVRIAALRAMANLFGPKARTTLLEVVQDLDETDKVRAQAARLLGRTGSGALQNLDAFLESDLSVTIRAGAVRGLGELGTQEAVERAIALAEGPPSYLRPVALQALAKIQNPEVTVLLTEVAKDQTRRRETRAAACRALVAAKDPAAVTTLAEILADRKVPAAVRKAAVDALGRMGRREALATVVKACDDPIPGVALRARLARTRLLHIRVR